MEQLYLVGLCRRGFFRHAAAYGPATRDQLLDLEDCLKPTHDLLVVTGDYETAVRLRTGGPDWQGRPIPRSAWGDPPFSELGGRVDVTTPNWCGWYLEAGRTSHLHLGDGPAVTFGPAALKTVQALRAYLKTKFECYEITRHPVGISRLNYDNWPAAFRIEYEEEDQGEVIPAESLSEATMSCDMPEDRCYAGKRLPKNDPSPKKNAGAKEADGQFVFHLQVPGPAVRKLYHLAVSATDAQDATTVRPVAVMASNADEAIGRALRWLKATYPEESGWYGHTADVWAGFVVDPDVTGRAVA